MKAMLKFLDGWLASMKLLLSLSIALLLLCGASHAQEKFIQEPKIEKIVYDDDKAVNNKEYFGWALCGGATSSSVWKIMRITYSGNDYTIEWAGGREGGYNYEWDERAAILTYE